MLSLFASARDDGRVSAFSPELRKVLLHALAAGRAALAELEDDQVPAGLRRVRAHTGGRLPAPLAVSLLAALDGDEGLRKSALEQLDAERAGAASKAFLERGEHWWAVVTAEAVRSALIAEARRADAEAAAGEKLRKQLDTAGRRLDRARAEWDLEKAELQERAGRARPGSTSDRRDLEAADKRIAELEESIAAEREDRLAAEQMVARLRERVRRTGRDRTNEASGNTPASSLGDDPITAARRLDLMAAAAPHHIAAVREEATGRSRSRPTLPSGVRPDQAEAIEWLATMGEPGTLLVDGYNVLHAIDPAGFTTGRARERLLSDLGRLARRARALRIAVVFDSSLPGAPDRRVTKSGIEVRFTLEEGIADDEIVEMAESARGIVVAVTSDRDLQARIDRAGGLAVFSEAFSEWAAG